MRSLTICLFSLMIALFTLTACGGDDLEIGKSCNGDPDCLGGICYTPALGGLPNAYCTKICASASDCPGDFECVSSPGSSTPSTCIKKIK